MNRFKKGLIIIGEACTGKSLLARFTIGLLPPESVYQIDGRTKKDLFSNKYIFSGLTPYHKAIYIDDISLKNVEKLISIHHKVEVNQRGKVSFIMPSPPIIVTAELPMSKIKALGSSFKRRFHIIEISQCGYGVFSPDLKQDNQEEVS